jgi:hypothetical protein
VESSCELGIESSGSIKCWETIECPNNWGSLRVVLSYIELVNLNNVRREASRHFRNKERKYLKDKINELATNSMSKNIRDLYRGINKFKRGYQPRNNLVKDESGDLLANSNNILNRFKNSFSQFLNVHNVNDVRQKYTQYIQYLVPVIFRLKLLSQS